MFPQSHIDLQTLGNHDHDAALNKKGWGRGFFGARTFSSTEVAKGYASRRTSIVV